VSTAGTTPVREAHRFDEAALARYLESRLDRFEPPLSVRQFSGGQSNPTFLIESGGGQYVLRKKPPGKLLPSAHQVDREYRVMTALRDSAVPVCRTRLYCEDESVIGTAFFVMDFVPGRVFRDVRLPGLEPAERRAIYDAMNAVLANLHAVDYRGAGLEDFGKPGNYIARQIGRWSKQWEASRTEPVEAMDRLMEWLPANIPAGGEVALVHGDFRLENMIFHPIEARVLALLDWELATIGHPLSDLAYNCMPYRTPPDRFMGLLGTDLRAAGIPEEADYVAAYCRRTGRDSIPHWNFYLGFSFFRSASILQGVYARALQGNASSENARELGASVRSAAETAWELARSG
jgi:aminoglycoside phosphotransferase (APT) family kinase protein